MSWSHMRPGELGGAGGVSCGALLGDLIKWVGGAWRSWSPATAALDLGRHGQEATALNQMPRRTEGQRLWFSWPHWPHAFV